MYLPTIIIVVVVVIANILVMKQIKNKKIDALSGL